MFILDWYVPGLPGGTLCMYVLWVCTNLCVRSVNLVYV